MRVRITNANGDPMNTKIIDDDTGVEIKNVTGVVPFPFDTSSKELRAELAVRVSSIDVVAEASLVTHCPCCNTKLKIIDYVDMLKYLPKGVKLEIKDDTITAYWDKDANIEWKQTDNPRIEIGEEFAEAHNKEFMNWLRSGKQPVTTRDWGEPSAEEIHRHGRDNPSTYGLPKSAHNVTSHYDETTGIMNISWEE